MADLVDGNNVIGRLGGGTRERLVTELAELARRKKRSLTVVFDGPPEHGRPKVQELGPLTVVYAAPRSADEEIVRRLREARDPRTVTVVTDDRVLAASASAAGARTEGVEHFARDATSRMARAAAPPPEQREKERLPAGNPSEWERWFADPRNRLK